MSQDTTSEEASKMSENNFSHLIQLSDNKNPQN